MDGLIVFLNHIIDGWRRIAPYIGRFLACIGRGLAFVLKGIGKGLAAVFSLLGRGLAAFGHAVARNPLVLVVVVVFAVIALVCALVWNSFSTVPESSGSSEESGAVIPSVTSVYDWSKAQLDEETGRYSFVVDGQSVTTTGVDVSDHQDQIDWEKVKADGIDYAIIRAGYRGTTAGDIKADTRCLENLRGAKAAGLKVGVYFFSQATSVDEAVEEVDFIAEQIGDTQLDYPVVYDAEVSSDQGEEGRTKNMTVEELTACCKAFCDAVVAHGWKPMIYGGQADLGRLNLNGDLADVPVWYAKYSDGWPDVSYNMTMWQYSYTMEIDGIPYGKADVNIDLTNAPRNKR